MRSNQIDFGNSEFVLKVMIAQHKWDLKVEIDFGQDEQLLFLKEKLMLLKMLVVNYLKKSQH